MDLSIKKINDKTENNNAEIVAQYIYNLLVL